MTESICRQRRHSAAIHSSKLLSSSLIEQRSYLINEPGTLKMDKEADFMHFQKLWLSMHFQKLWLSKGCVIAYDTVDTGMAPGYTFIALRLSFV